MWHVSELSFFVRPDSILLSVSAMFCLSIHQGFSLPLGIVKKAARWEHCGHDFTCGLFCVVPSLHECPRQRLAACLLVERANSLAPTAVSTALWNAAGP